MISRITAEEVMTLAPGQSQQLTGYFGRPTFEGPGVYDVFLRYEHRPVVSRLGQCDEQARVAIEASQAFAVWSTPARVRVR